MAKSITNEVTDLFNLSMALSTAVNARFMAPDHGAAIWKKFLKSTSLDVARVVKEEINSLATKGGKNVS